MDCCFISTITVTLSFLFDICTPLFQVQELKVKNGDSQFQGKKKMEVDVYQLMCELFLAGNDREYIFAHLFLCLEWNLMARSENVADCHADNVFWINDGLGFHFPKTKCDQMGKRGDAIWHVYANPENPAICCHASLSRYLLANPGILTMVKNTNDQPELVCNDTIEEDDAEAECSPETFNGLGMSTNIRINGENKHDRFMKCFHKVIRENADAFRRLGIEPGDLGSHSARKGAYSRAAAGSTASPPIVSICLWAMWSMGNMKERYLHYEKAGDQFLGRVVSGLNVDVYKFAVSPPYFDFNNYDGPAEEAEKKVDDLVKKLLLRGEKVEPRVFRIVRFCFASFLSFRLL